MATSRAFASSVAASARSTHITRSASPAAAQATAGLLHRPIGDPLGAPCGRRSECHRARRRVCRGNRVVPRHVGSLPLEGMSTGIPQPPPTSSGSIDAGEHIDQCLLVPIAPRDGDRWPLRGRYVEMVWSELLGPTAVLLLRRIGELADLNPFGVHFSIAAMSASLGVPPSKVRHSLARLGRLGLISIDAARGVVEVSGLAPSLRPELAARLSDDAAREHRWWQAEAADVRPGPSMAPGG